MKSCDAWRERKDIIKATCQQAGKAYIAAQNPLNAEKMNPFATNIIVVDGVSCRYTSNGRKHYVDTSAGRDLVMPPLHQYSANL